MVSQSSLAVVKPVFTVAHDHSKRITVFFRAHSMVVYKSIPSTNITASSLSYKVFEKAANSALSKVKFGHISSLTEPQSRSLFSCLCGNDTRQNFLKIFKHSWKTMVKKITFLNVHLLCRKHFIDCLFVLSVVFEKYLENSAAFGRAIVR